jgi:hypothetical protein
MMVRFCSTRPHALPDNKEEDGITLRWPSDPTIDATQFSKSQVDFECLERDVDFLATAQRLTRFDVCHDIRASRWLMPRILDKA